MKTIAKDFKFLFLKISSSDSIDQQRTNVFKSKVNLKIDELVLVKEANQFPLIRKIGRKIEMFSSEDNHVHVVKLNTAHRE